MDKLLYFPAGFESVVHSWQLPFGSFVWLCLAAVSPGLFVDTSHQQLLHPRSPLSSPLWICGSFSWRCVLRLFCRRAIPVRRRVFGALLALPRPPSSFSAQSQVFFKSFPAISHVTLWPNHSHIRCPGRCSFIIIIIHPSSPWSCGVVRSGVIMMYMIHDFSLFRTNTHAQHCLSRENAAQWG